MVLKFPSTFSYPRIGLPQQYMCSGLGPLCCRIHILFLPIVGLPIVGCPTTARAIDSSIQKPHVLLQLIIPHCSFTSNLIGLYMHALVIICEGMQEASWKVPVEIVPLVFSSLWQRNRSSQRLMRSSAACMQLHVRTVPQLCRCSDRSDQISCDRQN